MATNRRKYKKTGRGSGGNNNDPAKKRRRTNNGDNNDDANDEDDSHNDNSNNPLAQVVVVPDPAVSVAIDGSDNAAAVAAAVAATKNNDGELPTTDQLSRELCKIVDVVHYSRDESLRALDNLYTWASKGDNDSLKSFHIYGGIVKVLDFLKATMNDVNCKGSIRMECIEKAARVISTVTHTGENDENKNIATKNATTLLDCDGIDTLINASEEYTGGDDIPQLKAMRSVWNAFRNLTCILTKDLLMIQDTALTIFDTGIGIMSQLKSVDFFATAILGHVFCTLSQIVIENYITKKYFQDENILSKCLEVLKKNGVWNFRSREGLLHDTMNFVDCCRIKNLLDESLDSEMILPLLVVALKQFPSNDKIRGHAQTTRKYPKSGVMEPLGLLLASDEINDEVEKNKVRTLISKIIA
ncbi:hypothetical protein FRACYDRAFT_249572 [Fragilariopsis cylindrus CCMP1102]|uniref:Uncharacterized protein n=1 Tax=Fragilariopsis cylindrus CCMP1102 TaxID=635003 RepID=A0A1E7ERT6_9STRA|nr:hypothetical protein FRACYDRAFT_249572 [Fragilariopsis cylindrus CCMP1102]|eukprot:OEU08671.1 hypothetical protein FRACYDRAFT_249572 [Fragilariopsis cylindrus CCMP1102]